jgi:hypothetical protein
MSNIQASHWYLLTIFNRRYGYVDHFKLMGLRVWFYQTIYYPKGALYSSHHYPFALCWYHVFLFHYQT